LYVLFPSLFVHEVADWMSVGVQTLVCSMRICDVFIARKLDLLVALTA
jgi:hypothetical protein